MQQLQRVFVFLAAAGILAAQTDKATIRGTVTDPSQAVVPGVNITLTEVGTGVEVRKATSDANGNFEMPDLIPGTYRLQADSSGFRSFVADDVLVVGGQVRRVNVRLEVGATTESVTVTAGAAVVTTDTGTISGGIDKKEFADTPLIDVYPSPLAVLTTVPGIQGAGWNLVISGQKRAQLSQGMDGIENDRTGEQSNNMNFFEDVQVVAVNNTAESSRVVNYNMTSKRGASQFHGMVYYKHFNSAMNARLFFETDKVPFIQHEWQGEISGPIIKDKTFFYASWFAQRIPLGSFNRATVPSEQMRLGDFNQFSKAIVDPLNDGQPFPGKSIPTSRISGVSQKAQDLYIPNPNIGGPDLLTNNFGWTHPYHYDFFKGDWPIFRVDHNVTDNNSLYVRWHQRKTPYVLARNLPKMVRTRVRNHWQLVVSDTHVFSPMVVNTFRFGTNSNYIIDGSEVDGVTPIQGDEVVAAIGLQGVNPSGHSAMGAPRMDISGVTALSAVAGGINQDDKDYSYEESLTWARGRHVWKFGGEVKTFRNFNGVIREPNYGRFSFNGSMTGIGYADFLLGIPQRSRRLDPFTERTRTQKEVGMFVTDTFKPTSKLTLDLGIRWDYYSSPTYADGLMYNWDQASGNVVVTPEGANNIHPLYPSNITIVTGTVVPTPDKKNIRPRLSAAYRITDKTVLRGGYGAFSERLGNYFQRLLGGGPFEIGEDYRNKIENGQPLFMFPNPFPSDLATSAIPSQSVTGLPLQTDEGTIHQFNFSIERELGWDTGLRASYIGSRGRGLNYSLNVNKPPASDIPFSDDRRPNPQFVNTTVWRNDGQTNYDSIQFQVQKKTGPVTFNGHYTLSNNMANYLIREDPYNVTNRWARDDQTRRHYAVIYTNWQMPFGKGRRYLSNAPGIVDRLIGGWMLQTVSYFASGTYFSPSFSGSDPSNTDTFGGLPDRIADGNLPSGQRSPDLWFDPSAFAEPAPGHYGNSGANILEAQGINVHHLSLAKRFPLTERFSATFTGAISNLFNTPHFASIRTDILNPGAGQYTSVVADYNPEKQTGRRVSLKLRVEW